MKKKIIIAVSVILLVAALITGWVFWKMSKKPDKNPSETVSQNQSDYCLVDGVLFSKDMTEIISYPSDKEDKEYEIPDSVTTVRHGAFYDVQSLEKIIIGKGLKKFEVINSGYSPEFEFENPFDTCDNLKSVTVDKDNPYFCSDRQGALYTKDMKVLITVPAGRKSKKFTVPDSVESANYSFTNCAELEVINIGRGLENLFIHSYADEFNFYGFKNCQSLKKINVSEDNPYFKSIDGVLYSKNGRILVMYPPSKKGETFVIPEHVTFIDWKAFRLNKYIEKLYVGKNVGSLDVYLNNYFYFAEDDYHQMMFDVYYEEELNMTMNPYETEHHTVYYNSTMPQ